MISMLDNGVFRWIGVVAVLAVFSGATNSDAAMLVPTSLSGAISYGYGYSKSSGGGEGESQTISVGVNGSGFYWQPWFITLNGGLTVAFSRSDSSTASSTSKTQAWGGSLGMDVFPVSRFPFSLTINHSNSLLEDTQVGGISGSREFTSTRLLARQSYLARSGYVSHLAWSHGRFVSEESTSTSDVITADTRKTFPKSSVLASANYYTSSDSNSDTKPQNWGARVNHNYVPGNQLGVSNLVTTSGSKSESSRFSSKTQTVQAASSFSWRPEYKPYNFSGGARIARSESSQEQTGFAGTDTLSNAASLSLGVNYRLTRKIVLGISGGGSGSFDKSDGVETTNTNANASIGTSYGSDQYSILGFQYGWNLGGGLGGVVSNTKISGDTDTEGDSSKQDASASVNAGHHASRNWSLGRATIMGLSLSQSVGGSVSDDHAKSASLGTGLGLSGSTRGGGGSTFAGISLSHSYSISRSDASGIVSPSTDPNPEDTRKTTSETMFASLNISRNQTLNRLSALTANGSTQWSKQASTNQDDTISRSANASLSYRHMRAFGIYAMSYNSLAGYSLIFNPDEEQIASMFWDNSLQYSVGLLDMSLEINLNKESNGTKRGSLRFRATRSF